MELAGGAAARFHRTEPRGFSAPRRCGVRKKERGGLRTRAAAFSERPTRQRSLHPCAGGATAGQAIRDEPARALDSGQTLAQ